MASVASLVTHFIEKSELRGELVGAMALHCISAFSLAVHLAVHGKFGESEWALNPWISCYSATKVFRLSEIRREST